MLRNARRLLIVSLGIALALSVTGCKADKTESESLSGTVWVSLLGHANSGDVWKLRFTSSTDVAFIKINGQNEVYSTITGTYVADDSAIVLNFAGVSTTGTLRTSTIEVTLGGEQSTYSKQ